MTVADVPAHVASDDDENRRWLNDGHPSTVESTTAWVERNAASWEAGGSVRNFGVVGAAGLQLLGMVEANLDWAGLGYAQGDANVSYQVYPAARGRGVATRAVRLLCRYLTDATPAKRAVMSIDERNVASRAVARRLGAVDAGVHVAGGTIRRRYVLDL